MHVNTGAEIIFLNLEYFFNDTKIVKKIMDNKII